MSEPPKALITNRLFFEAAGSTFVLATISYTTPTLVDKRLVVIPQRISVQISASSANTLSDFSSAIVIKKNSDN